MRLGLNTIPGLMAVAAVLALILATFLVPGSDRGDPTLGLLLIVASTACVAAIKAAESLDRPPADRERATFRRLSTTVLMCGGAAALIVGLSDLAFLLTYDMVVGGRSFSSMSGRPVHGSIEPLALIAGGIAAFAVCCLARQALGRSLPARGRIFRWLAPFAIVTLMLGANLTLRRVIDRLDRAAHHDDMASLHGGESRVPAPPSTTGFRRRPELANYHVRMRRKWERAAARPWLSVEPDPPLPAP